MGAVALNDAAIAGKQPTQPASVSAMLYGCRYSGFTALTGCVLRNVEAPRCIESAVGPRFAEHRYLGTFLISLETSA